MSTLGNQHDVPEVSVSMFDCVECGNVGRQGMSALGQWQDRSGLCPGYNTLVCCGLLYSGQCFWCTEYRTLYCVTFTVYREQCAVHRVQCTLLSVLYSVLCTH